MLIDEGDDITRTDVERPFRDAGRCSRHYAHPSALNRRIGVFKQRLVRPQHREGAMEEGLNLTIMRCSHEPLEITGCVGALIYGDVTLRNS